MLISHVAVEFPVFCLFTYCAMRLNGIQLLISIWMEFLNGITTSLAFTAYLISRFANLKFCIRSVS